MKHIKLFEQFVNEVIEIKSVEDHGVSNSNKYDLIKKHSGIIDILKDPDQWTDDLVFLGSDKKKYSIDDLIDREVRVGSTVITVEESFVNEADDVLKEANKLLRKLKWGRNDLKSEYTNAANKYDARKNGVMNKGEFLDALTKALKKNGLSDLITNLREDKYGDPEGDLGKFVIMMNASWDGEIAIAYGDYIIARTAGLRPGAPIYAPTPEATIDMYIDILKSSRDVLEEIKNL